MVRRNRPRGLFTTAACGIVLWSASSALADIPATYKGTPFDPAKAGGPKCPPTVVAGPYPIPGRLDFVNYDLGGEGVSYHTGDHITKGGTGYRTDTPTATFSLTSDCIPNGGPPTCTNVWYDTSTTLDGTPYPSATTADFSIGAVQVGDYFDITVNVATAGTYAVSSTWATGNGPPGGEGGDGAIGLEIFSNDVKLATWNDVFPNYNTEADFHHWKAYPSFTTVTLAAGLQVIKLQSLAKHFQLDYVQFDLTGPDGGLIDSNDSGTGGTGSSEGGTTSGASGASSTSGSVASGASSTSGSVASGSTSSGGAGAESGSTAPGSTASSGAGSATGSTTSEPASGASTGSSNATSGGSANGGSSGGSKGCSIDRSPHARGEGLGAFLLVAGIVGARRRKAARSS